ncbi:MAG: Ig-like domain-containing protein [Clostridia bacterium]|nr:Ig-like domain-containing protein [Clostridia bacterium]
MTRVVRLSAAVAVALCALLLLIMPAWAEEVAAPTITLNYESAEINLAVTNRGGTLVPTVSPAPERPRFTYASSDKSVASVSGSGLITAHKPGEATITVTLRDTDLTASCSVVVKDSRIPETIALDVGEAITVERYTEFTLTPTISPSIADQSIKWKSSNSSVASVSSKGVVTAKKGGTAVITCTSRRSDNVFAAVTVTVNQYPSPTAISISPDTGYMVVGSTLQLQPVTEPVGVQVCSFYKWKTSSSRIAAITDDGLLTAKSPGFVTVTCSSVQDSRVKATRKILVVTPDSPYYLTLNTPDAVTLNPTDTMQLTAAVFPADRAQTVRWSTSRSSVVSVDQNGFITAHKAGTAVITAASTLNKLVSVELTVNVVNLPAPDSIVLSAPSATIELGDTLQLTAITYPLNEKRSREFKWSSSSSSIARVSDTGLVTARSTGAVTITCASVRDRHVKQTITLTVVDSKMPDSIAFDGVTGDISMENSQQLTLTPVILPATATQTVTWKSSKTSVATVTSDGVVTAQRAGTAYIYATSTYSSRKSVRVKVVVTNKAAPVSLSFAVPHLAVYKGRNTLLSLQPSPADASVMCAFQSSDDSIAAVDANGRVTTGGKTGQVTITARSLKNSGAVAVMTLAVFDDNTPGSVLLSKKTLYMGKGARQQLNATVYPATAPQNVKWSSANESIATVDATGCVRAAGIGTTIVTASTPNGVTARCQVSVTAIQVASVIPARTTGVAGISLNMAKISAIENSALDTIDYLASTEAISMSEASERKSIIKRAFAMQAFPWMTLNTQEYWTPKFAEKRYLPGIVYYGLPYTQAGKSGSWNNRNYNVVKALNENRYYDSGNGYYILNQRNLLDKSYVGCDCSSFVNMATFGMNHPASFLKTYTMNTSSYYKTLSSYSELRPGDHLVLAKSHVVMFLYWMNAEKTQFMIIEQGGDGSTVICSIKNAAYYSSQDYVPRRVKTFG